MAITTLTSREFNQDIARAKRSARKGPVYITDRGRPDLVLLSFEDYRKIRGPKRSLADALCDPRVADIELDLPPRSRDSSLRVPDFD